MRNLVVLFSIFIICGSTARADDFPGENNITVLAYDLNYFVDESNQLQFSDIFNDSITFNQFTNAHKWAFADKNNSNYWIKVDIPFSRMTGESYMIEAIDSHINYIEAWLISNTDTLHFGESGYLMKFANKHTKHKNFIYDIPPRFATDPSSYFLFKIRSKQTVPLIFKFRSLRHNIQYSNTEYAGLFFFYGVIFLLALYNILSYLFIRERKYLLLLLYIFASGIIATSEDSTLFQFLWPNTPEINWTILKWSIPLYLVALINYLIEFLDIKSASRQHALRLFTIAYFIIVQQLSKHLTEQVVGILFLSYSLIILVFAIRKSIHSNIVIRLITIGFTISIIGILPKIDFLREDVIWLIYYFNFTILIQGIIFTLALIYDYRITKSDKEKAQSQIITNLENRKRLIEEKVIERTLHIEEQKKVINEKNMALADAYDKLSEKAEMIDQINLQLKNSNKELEGDLEQVKEAHLINRPLDFEDFKKRFLNEDLCLKYIDDRKWKSGYICKKCNSSNYKILNNNKGRRCSKCGYVESITSGTIFHRLHFPIEKAFYLIFHIGMNESQLNNIDMANNLEIPANTCSRFSKKIMMRKKELHVGNKTALDKIILGETTS